MVAHRKLYNHKAYRPFLLLRRSHINGNLYHYAGNNPVKYTDPDGEQSIDFNFKSLLDLTPDAFNRLFNEMKRADNGDKNAQARLNYVFHEVGRGYLTKINEASSVGELAFCMIGCPEAAAACSIVNALSGGFLALDDFYNGNYASAIMETTIMVAGYKTGKLVGNAVEKAAGVEITIGKNKHFYEIGRKGALKSADAIQKLVEKDIANGFFGKTSSEVTSQVITATLNAYKAVIEDELQK